MNILDHPILGKVEAAKRKVTLFVNGRSIEAYEGQPIAAALMAVGIKSFRQTARKQQDRGIFCGIGRCTDCMMTVNGEPNVRTCVTPVAEGMIVETQIGLGSWREIPHE